VWRAVPYGSGWGFGYFALTPWVQVKLTAIKPEIEFRALPGQHATVKTEGMQGQRRRTRRPPGCYCCRLRRIRGFFLLVRYAEQLVADSDFPRLIWEHICAI